MSIHFSSKSDLWSSPEWVFQFASSRWGPFSIDLCASVDNTKCAKFYSVEDDSLAQDWSNEIGWMNHPYSRQSGGAYEWLGKAKKAATNGSATIVCLTPARPDTRAWQEHVMDADEVIFIASRLKFGAATNPAPFPSALVAYLPKRSWPGPNNTTYTLRSTARPVFSVIERVRARA